VKYDRWQPPFANDPALAALTDEQIDALAEVILSRATPGQVLASGRSSWQPFPREHLRSGDRVKLRATFDRGVPVYLSQTWATVVKVGLTGVVVEADRDIPPGHQRRVRLDHIEERAERNSR
jgi:hypothetical protein